jgi:hypothetical protein
VVVTVAVVDVVVAVVGLGSVVVIGRGGVVVVAAAVVVPITVPLADVASVVLIRIGVCGGVSVVLDDDDDDDDDDRKFGILLSKEFVMREESPIVVRLGVS